MPPGVRWFGLLLLCGAAPIGGCTLVDQATFNPSLRPVAAKHPAPPTPAVEANGALLTISLAHGEPDYQTALKGAVQQALAVKPNIIFQVISLVPQQGSTLPSWDQAEAVTTWGRRVAEQIQQDGVDPGQIELGLRATPGLDQGEIRVYVQ